MNMFSLAGRWAALGNFRYKVLKVKNCQFFGRNFFYKKVVFVVLYDSPYLS